MNHTVELVRRHLPKFACLWAIGVALVLGGYALGGIWWAALVVCAWIAGLLLGARGVAAGAAPGWNDK